MSGKFTQNKLLLTFKLFLKTWVNIILKERNIYPSSSFELRNSFNLSVPWNRNPELNDWLNELIDNLIKDNNTFEHVCFIHLVIYGATGIVKERFVLNIKEFYKISYKQMNVVINEDELTYKSLYDELRANIFSLLKKIRTLKRNEEHKFMITCEASDGLNLGKNWVLDDDNDYVESSPQTPSQTLPLRLIDVGPMCIYSSIEVYNE